MLNVFRVDGGSMYPSLASRDRVLTLRCLATGPFVSRGQVIILHSPEDRSKYLVKRIVAIPGDTVGVVRGRVMVNGSALKESYVSSRTLESVASRRLSADQYFVLGDNRRISIDSRAFGPISSSQIRASVLLRVWPLWEAGGQTERRSSDSF
jgi:signal peptidase I